MSNERIRFYRGTSSSNLPNTYNEGAIYVLAPAGSNVGSLYVDIRENQRIKVGDGSSNFVQIKRYNETSETSSEGVLYVVLDQQNQPWGLKLGDGKAPIVDLPYIKDEDLVRRIIALENAINDQTNGLTVLVNNLTTSVNNLKTTIENKETELKTSITNLTTSVSNLTTSVSNVTTSVSNLTTSVSTLFEKATDATTTAELISTPTGSEGDFRLLLTYIEE